MPTFTRAVVLGLQAAALVSTLGPSSTPLGALALPIAAPPMRFADYAAKNPGLFTSAAAVPQTDVVSAPQNANTAAMPVARRASSAASHDVHSRSVAILSSLTEQMTIISGLAGRSAAEGNDPIFRDNAVASISSFQTGLLSLQSLIETDKGLGFYDKNNELETAIKDLVNSLKDTLKYIDELVGNIPILGSTLEPVVFQIKCILIDVLDLLEDVLDQLINELKPTVLALIGKATNTGCEFDWKCEGVLL
ncbi:uncharacterized protein BXZ73DRAFT_73914 [Epithele typhae]|uniref:uncharacterized protein n=1 Tax=Epithele typhae TaxID=378194 RepID=UPI0020077342|nr:uncharacterized protein BXZ73DRAFT_73914 [Epithele typhae]KAH9944388.1 hypothetical protein BXZ73DRAFT_73914 [Epithele typhae]